MGNVTTSYTVLYSSNPVGVGCCLAVLRRRALSCLPGGWCRVLVALGVAVSGYSGRPFSRVLAFLSSFSFVRTPLSLTRQSFVSYLSYLIFCPRFWDLYASPRGRVPRHAECVSLSLSWGYCSPMRGIRAVFVLLFRRSSPSIPSRGECMLWPSGWPRLCREPVSGPPAPCKA